MNDKSLIIAALVAIIGVGIVLSVMGGTDGKVPALSGATTTTEVAGGPNLALAQCLKESGVVFYGAFWCPHCKKQKEDFGAAVPALPYVECSTADGNDQTPICKAKGIKSYPTWIFADGSQLTGAQELATLAEKSSCTQALTGKSTTTSSSASGTPK